MDLSASISSVPHSFRPPTVFAAIAMAAFGIFVLDVTVPFGLPWEIAYAVLVLGSFWLPRGISPFVCAAGCSVLSFAAEIWDPAAGEALFIGPTRAFGIAAIWLVAIIFYWRQQAERTTIENSDRLQAIVSTLIDGIIIFGADGMVRMCNPSGAKLFGYDIDAIEGEHISTLVPDLISDQASSSADMHAAFDIGGFRDVARERTGVRKDGSTFRVEVAVSEPPSGHEPFFVGVVRDITERKIGEVQIHQQALIWQQISNGVLILDLNGVIVDMNPGAEKLIGYSRSELIGKDTRELAVPRSVRERIDDAMSSEARWSGEIDVRHKDGRTLTCDVVVIPLLDEHGTMIGRLGVNRDITDRKNAEAQIRQQALIWQQISEGVLILDLNGVIVDMNPGAEKLFGYRKSEAIGSDIKNWVLPHHADSVRRSVNESMAIQGRWSGEMDMRHKDGRTLTVDAVVIPLLDEHGTTIGRIGVERDITDRKMAESQIRQQALIWQQISDGVFILDLNRVVIDLNPGAENLAGYSRSEALGMHVEELSAATDPNAERMSIDTSLEVDGRWSGEIELRHKDGRILTVDVVVIPLLDEHGKMIGRIGVNRDITDRKRAERALRRLASIVDTTSDAIMVTDQNNIITDWNKGAETLFGYTKDTAIGQPNTIIVPDELHQDRGSTFQRPEFVQDLQSFEFVCKTMDGTLIDTSISSSSFDGEPDDRSSGFYIVRDMTEQKQMEEAIFQSQKMQALGQLAGGIAHDFNNLLFPIITISEIVIEDIADNAEAAENLAGVIAAAKQGRELVDRIMAYSRQMPRERQPADIGQLVVESAKLLEATISPAIRITVDVDRDIGAVFADATQLGQVIMNLGVNASHAIGLKAEHGHIEFAVRGYHSEEELVVGGTALSAGHYVRLEVSDSGCGMGADTLRQIFDPYFTTKPVGEGVGLGLAAAHGIIADHGGAISVSSDPGIGTRFEIYIPTVDQSEIATPEFIN